MANIFGIEVSGDTYDLEDSQARQDTQTNENNIGILANLATTVKTNLVNAINEVFGLSKEVDIPFSSLTNVDDIITNVDTATFNITKKGKLVVVSFAHVGLSGSAGSLTGDVTVLEGLPKAVDGNRFGVFYSIEKNSLFLAYVTKDGYLNFAQGRPGNFEAGNHIYGTICYISE